MPDPDGETTIPAGLPLAVEILVEAGAWPPAAHLEALASRAVEAVFAELVRDLVPESEVSLVFTDDEAIRRLNAEWRNSDKPTNVLSFSGMPHGTGGAVPAMLGDIVLAAETVRGEAEAEHKTLDHHLAHLIVHGLLHLLGFDHEDDAEAEVMEEAERRVLARLAIADPYN